ncbi:WD40-repeat-containing domain protein [Limtongia smithiae]|uniref:WD40-repeat-containing domain protein n=1 Tax=Limtongia smithiae TaxID=1125753 RepID=UPI0034CF1CBB
MSFPLYAKGPALSEHSGPVHVVRYNTTGQYILSGGQDKRILLWNSSSLKLVKSYVAHGYEILDISVSFDNAQFLSCGRDRLVFLWDVASGTAIRRLAGHTAQVNAVNFNTDASVAASGSYDSTVRLWDLKSNSQKPLQVLDEAKDSVSSVQIVGSQIITGSVDGYLRVYDLRMGQLYEDLIGHPITSVMDSADSACALVSTLDSTVRLMDKSNGTLLQSFTGHDNHKYRIRSCFGDNETYAISGSENGKIFVWDVLSGRVVHQLRSHNGSIVACVAYHPRSTQMVSCGSNGTIQVWQST